MLFISIFIFIFILSFCFLVIIIVESWETIRVRNGEREVDTIGFSEHVACNVLLLVQTGGTVNQNPCQ